MTFQVSSFRDQKKPLLLAAFAAFILFMSGTFAMPCAAGPKSAGVVKPFGDKWAVVIGIGDFADPNVPQLKYSAKDAKDFYEYLIDPKLGKFQKDHVKLLVDVDATKVNIMDMLGDSFLPHAAQPDDLVVIYLSTHGSPAGADIRGVNYVIAHDTQLHKLFATGIDMKQLLRTIKERVHTNRILLILDTCYSGAGAGAGGHKGLIRTNIDSTAAAQGIGSLVITSSSSDQRAWESDTLKNSYFTRYLIDSLKEAQEKPVEMAFSSMKQRVQSAVLKDKGEMQTPVLAGAFSGPSLILSTPASVTREAPVTLPFTTETASPGSRTASLTPGRLNFSDYATHLRNGLRLADQHKLWDAIHEFELAIKLNPTSIEANLIAASIYDQQGRKSEALEAAKRAVRNDPNSSRAREMLSLAYLHSGNVDESLRQLQSAITLDPANSMAHNMLGFINEHKFNRVDLAEQEYRTSLEYNSLNVRALVNLANLLVRQNKKLDEAESLYKKAVEADSDDWEARLGLGKILYTVKSDPKAAETELRKAIDLAPANAHLHSELGNLLAMDEARFHESEVEFKKGIDLAKDKAFPHLALASFLLRRLGRIDEAEKEFRAAIDLDPNEDSARVGLAALLVEQKHIYDQSDVLYREALKINPKNAQAHIGLSEIQIQLYKNYPQAHEELQKAIVIAPNNSEAHKCMGVLLSQYMPRAGESKPEFEKAIECDPRNASAHFEYAQVLTKHFKEYPLAKDHYEKAISLDPKVSKYHTALGALLVSQFKQFKEAETLFRRAIKLNMEDSEAHYRLGVLLIEKLKQRKEGESELTIAIRQKPDDKEFKAAHERYVR